MNRPVAALGVVFLIAAIVDFIVTAFRSRCQVCWRRWAIFPADSKLDPTPRCFQHSRHPYAE